MNAAKPSSQFNIWRSDHLFNIDFASYTLTHHHFPRHFHDHYVIEFVVNGIDEFYCDGQNYAAQSQQFVLINPGEVHTGNTVSDIPLRYYSLYPDLTALEKIASALSIDLPANFCFQHSLIDQSRTTSKFKRLFDALVMDTEPLLQQQLLLDCMNDLLQSSSKTSEPPIRCEKDQRVKTVIDYIRCHYKQPVTLDELAREVRLNPFYLVRLFKKCVSISPYEYLLIVRAEKAKQLLRKGVKVMDAATETCFFDSSHFNRMFYKLSATSPRSFRSSKSQYRTSFAG